MKVIQRDMYWDSLKGFLIVLVVFGHMLQCAESSTSTINWIYTFHMPLFVLISGYFSNPKSLNFMKGTCLIFETYVVYQLVYRFLFSGWSIHNLLVPSWAMWYLLSLFFWRMLIWLWGGVILTHRFWCFVLSIVLAVFVGFIPIGSELSFQRTFSFMPFFIMGFLMRNMDYKKYIDLIPSWLAWSVLVGAGLVSCFVHRNYLAEFGCADYYNPDSYVVQLLYRVLRLIVGFVMSIAVIRIWRGNILLAKLGEVTLFIYIFHVIFFQLLQILIANGLPNGYFVICVYSVLVILLLFLISRIPYINILLTPFSSVKKIITK